ncbi:MAG: hypothetical protein A2017_15905 [Lentisphaerae bacterium GWF2_44_16]|nr:MAG: hypothetical protein A2017_15905 [Lentisphaerae bacterium GWF2_44_16]
MNLQNIAALFLRLLSLTFLINLINSFVYLFRVKNDFMELLFVFCFIIIFASVMILLWVFALPLATFLTKKIPKDVSFGAMSLRDCYTIVFVATGLFYTIREMPDVIYWVFNILKAIISTTGGSWKSHVSFSSVLHAFVPFIAGILLLRNGPSWADVLTKKQGNKESPEENKGI